ncbi:MULTISPECIES: SMEK domain-containing protein [Klebsiella]|uniref:SMEK domain-containing protein n=2 Tax=Klebsiella TaxID=570 RepID=UPI000E43FACE|nr:MULTISPECIES: SMEK domain-containing protein [Klebsiella]RGL52484.1 hypothetical protein DXC65_08610 [Klebsiella pneumoniae]
MLTRQVKNNNITFAFSLLSTVITFNSKQGLFDINKTMEIVLTDLLNEVYDLSLINLNIIKHNHPAIDLGDKSQGIAVQVTSDGSKAKFSKTVDKFFEWGLDQTYNAIWMMVISNDPLEEHSRKGVTTHTINLSYVANSICNKNAEEFDRLYEFCENNFGAYFPKENNSILKPMQAASVNPGSSISNFLMENSIDLNDSDSTVSEQDIRSDLILLKDELSRLNEGQRWFIFRVMEYTIEYNKDKFIEECIAPVSLFMNGMDYKQQSSIKETADSLSFMRLANYDEYNNKLQSAVYVIFFEKGRYEYFDYFSAIAVFLRNTQRGNLLEDIIVGCNFSHID